MYFDPQKIMEVAQVNALLKTTIDGLPTEMVMSSLVGCLANIVGPMEDDKWRQIQHESETPCGTPGCGCHVAKSQLFQVLEVVREDHRRVVALMEKGQMPMTTFSQGPLGA